MKELIEKGIVTALGATKLAFEMAQDVVRDMIESGKMTAEEGEHFLQNLSAKVETEKGHLKDMLSGKLSKDEGEHALATQKDIADLKAHIAKMDERLTKLEYPREELQPGQDVV